MRMKALLLGLLVHSCVIAANGFANHNSVVTIQSSESSSSSEQSNQTESKEIEATQTLGQVGAGGILGLGVSDFGNLGSSGHVFGSVHSSESKSRKTSQSKSGSVIMDDVSVPIQRFLGSGNFGGAGGVINGGGGGFGHVVDSGIDSVGIAEINHASGGSTTSNIGSSANIAHGRHAAASSFENKQSIVGSHVDTSFAGGSFGSHNYPGIAVGLSRSGGVTSINSVGLGTTQNTNAYPSVLGGHERIYPLSHLHPWTANVFVGDSNVGLGTSSPVGSTGCRTTHEFVCVGSAGIGNLSPVGSVGYGPTYPFNGVESLGFYKPGKYPSVLSGYGYTSALRHPYPWTENGLVGYGSFQSTGVENSLLQLVSGGIGRPLYMCKKFFRNGFLLGRMMAEQCLCTSTCDDVNDGIYGGYLSASDPLTTTRFTLC